MVRAFLQLLIAALSLSCCGYGWIDVPDYNGTSANDSVLTNEANEPGDVGPTNTGDTNPGSDADPSSNGDSASSNGDSNEPEPADQDPGPPFSFFVSSLEAMRELSGSEDGFGGDLGGLAGADDICQQIAAGVGAGHKTWRAFLSVTSGPDHNPVDAIDRIGVGPWYDANGRLVAENIDGLMSDRPNGDPQIVEDLPDEYGRGLSQFGDNHDVVTGSDAQGRLDSTDPTTTCQDWTSAVGPGSERQVTCGHSWPARSGQNWISAHKLAGCSPGVNLVQNGPGEGDCIGCSGGYGGIYCFALSP
ncbi:hypothetical protein ACFL6C_01505 [Myxococcota bacterium]